MSEPDAPAPYVWKNPLAAWGTADRNAEAPSIRVPDPREIWRETRAFKVKTHPVGRLKYFIVWAGHGQTLWARTRWWPTRRNALAIKGLYNRKTAIAEKQIIDRRPI